MSNLSTVVFNEREKKGRIVRCVKRYVRRRILRGAVLVESSVACTLSGVNLGD